jgi:hypothetical protein
METYLSGDSVALSVEYQNENGETITPTGISISVYDEEEVLVHGPLTPAVGAGSSVTVTIPGGANTLATGKLRGARQAKVAFTTVTGVVRVNKFYIIESSNELVVPTNSFQTLATAVMTASMMQNIDGWNGATDKDRKIALLEAYRRISRLSFASRYIALDVQRVITWPGETVDREFGPIDFEEMTKASFDKLPARFKEALIFAQVAEASDVLMPDPIEEKRMQGLLAESIGESSMMFKTMRPISSGIGDKAKKYLSGFLRRRVKIGRA